MYRIGVLAEEKMEGWEYEKKIREFCSGHGIFPELKTYWDQETFFKQIQKSEPTSVFLALHGVAGLNAAEHLRSLYPRCGIIWCSDLDFSLHAFWLRWNIFSGSHLMRKCLRKGWMSGLRDGRHSRSRELYSIERTEKQWDRMKTDGHIL